ncbi:hypothetical protein EON80_27590 [bacterium]|nr:MAG: hypothetical protein EON80_27590 [bacterium]
MILVLGSQPIAEFLADLLAQCGAALEWLYRGPEQDALFVDDFDERNRGLLRISQPGVGIAVLEQVGDLGNLHGL